MFESYYPYLALLLAEGFGPGEITELLRDTADPPAELFHKLQSEKGLKRLSAELGRPVGNIPWDEFEAQLQLIEASGTGVVCIADPDYPAYLMDINRPPPVLFYRGRLLALHHRGVAIVGTRKPSPQGTAFSRSLARDLSKLGIMVVSGLARGIDSASHQGSLAGPGPAVGVIGTGIDVVYPPENRSLTAEVAAAGCVVTELLMGFGPKHFTFPQRNRLISALARIIIVIEAGPRSGALITARWAIEQGREVGAVPGFPGDFRSRGVNRLLKTGAVLIENSKDVLRAVPLLQDSFLPAQASGSTAGQGRIGAARGGVRKTRETAPGRSVRDEQELSRSETEAGEILSALTARPTAPDALASYLGKSISTVQTVLLDLEMRGLAGRDLSGCYYRPVVDDYEP
jgi:DNA processing protein